MYAMNIGSAVPSMTVKILDCMNVLIPSDEVMERYDTFAQIYLKKVTLLKKQNNYLTESRDRLLPKLMSGELEV